MISRQTRLQSRVLSLESLQTKILIPSFIRHMVKYGGWESILGQNRLLVRKKILVSKYFFTQRIFGQNKSMSKNMIGQKRIFTIIFWSPNEVIIEFPIFEKVHIVWVGKTLQKFQTFYFRWLPYGFRSVFLVRICISNALISIFEKLIINIIYHIFYLFSPS